jgi:energy-coupling factor transporter ATP-binding protein EcfA2
VACLRPRREDNLSALRIERLATKLIGPISFDIAAGKCLALMGPSGVGKSLLLRAIVDLEPSTGNVMVGARARDDMPASVAEARCACSCRIRVVGGSRGRALSRDVRASTTAKEVGCGQDRLGSKARLRAAAKLRPLTPKELPTCCEQHARARDHRL